MTQTVSLSDAITLQRGFDLPTSQRKPGRYPVVTSTGMATTHDEFKVEGPGVVIGRSGSIGGGQYITGDFWPLNTTLWVKDFKANNEKFIYYLLKSLDFSSFNAGAAVPTLNRNHLSALKVTIPDRITQDKIANILGTLDEKIELNRQMNETLEQMGQALFRHYFVDNPEVETWKEGTIADLGEVVTGKTPSKANPDYYGSDVMFLKVPDMHGNSIIIDTEDKLSMLGADSQSKKYIPKWSTCVSCIATVGVISLVGDSLQTNQQINSIIPNNESYSLFNYYLMKSKSEVLKTMASGGSATPNLNKGHFESIKVKLPPAELLEKFQSEAEGLLGMVYENTRQTQTLTTLRDTLLPRLINGKVRI